MDEFLAFYLRVFIALVAICDPLGNMPIFVSLTSSPGPPEAKVTARMTAVAVLIVFTVFAFFGARILGVFGISMGAFRAAGGILLVLMGVAMLRAAPQPMRTGAAEEAESRTKENVAVVPMAIPLVSGPGAMSTVILFAHQAGTATQVAAQHAAHLTVAIVVYAAFRVSTPVVNRLGRTGINIVTRIMGLIVVAIGVEFLAGGARELFPMLAGGS